MNRQRGISAIISDEPYRAALIDIVNRDGIPALGNRANAGCRCGAIEAEAHIRAVHVGSAEIVLQSLPRRANRAVRNADRTARYRQRFKRRLPLR